TYNRDLQEDKERLFDTADTARACVRLMTAMLANTTVNAAVCAAAARDPQLLATDLAEYLVKKGRPFRQAHHAVGALVARAEELNKPLDQLTLVEFQRVDDAFGPDVIAVFNLGKAMARRQLAGAPGTRQVRRQLVRWKKQFT
ncbi:MAG: argininosuccinate lyase, partial [Verrucomicrobia bacterium]